jgi:hypothetical protein
MKPPAYNLKTKWLPAAWLPEPLRRVAQAELERAARAPGWNPKAIWLRGDMYLLDVCSVSGETRLHSVRVALVRDHPFLKVLDGLGNAPRVVKALYRKSVRLAFARAGDGWAEHNAREAAVEAWEKYLANR